MRSIRLDPEAESELQTAAAYYAARSKAVARRFLRNVLDRSKTIAQHPHRFPVLVEPESDPPIRRALIRNFPYALVFIAFDEFVSVLAVAHFSKSPDYWLHRVSDPVQPE